MAYEIKCAKLCKDNSSWAGNIVDLLNKRDEQGYFKAACGHRGYVERDLALQEAGETWEPFLRGAISLGARKAYRPFVYLVSYKANGPINDLWFAYYKDMRKKGGRLKLGHGPGGPPVLGSQDLLTLLYRLISIGVLSRAKVVGGCAGAKRASRQKNEMSGSASKKRSHMKKRALLYCVGIIVISANSICTSRSETYDCANTNVHNTVYEIVREHIGEVMRKTDSLLLKEISQDLNSWPSRQNNIKASLIRLRSMPGINSSSDEQQQVIAAAENRINEITKECINILRSRGPNTGQPFRGSPAKMKEEIEAWCSNNKKPWVHHSQFYEPNETKGLFQAQNDIITAQKRIAESQREIKALEKELSTQHKTLEQVQKDVELRFTTVVEERADRNAKKYVCGGSLKVILPIQDNPAVVNSATGNVQLQFTVQPNLITTTDHVVRVFW